VKFGTSTKSSPAHGLSHRLQRDIAETQRLNRSRWPENRLSSFPNSVWERTCLGNSVAFPRPRHGKDAPFPLRTAAKYNFAPKTVPRHSLGTRKLILRRYTPSGVYFLSVPHHFTMLGEYFLPVAHPFLKVVRHFLRSAVYFLSLETLLRRSVNIFCQSASILRKSVNIFSHLPGILRVSVIILRPSPIILRQSAPILL
jgi:hypothetical protein